MRFVYLLILALPILFCQLQQGGYGDAVFSFDEKKNISFSQQDFDLAARDERPSDCVLSGRCRG